MPITILAAVVAGVTNVAWSYSEVLLTKDPGDRARKRRALAGKETLADIDFRYASPERKQRIRQAEAEERARNA